MKRIILFLVSFFAVVVIAQERDGNVMVEVGMGLSQYGNYSPLSVFADHTESYHMLTSEYITVGYRSKENWAAGITFSSDGGNTSFIEYDETCSNVGGMLEVREYFPIGSRIELTAGVAGGLLLHYNRFNYNNADYSFRRIGYMGNLTIGVNYMIGKNKHVGINWHPIQAGYYADKEPVLPTSLNGNREKTTVGSSLMISCGIRF